MGFDTAANSVDQDSFYRTTEQLFFCTGNHVNMIWMWQMQTIEVTKTRNLRDSRHPNAIPQERSK